MPFRDRVLLLAALVLLPLVRLALRLVGFGRLCRALAYVRPFPARGSTGQSDETGLVRARSTAALVRLAATRGIYRGNCLDQSVTVWWLLRLQGLATEIRIGVRKHPHLEAHAWVELGSVVVNDWDDVRRTFEPFSGALIRNVPIR